jgi:hypothetical protein
LVSDDSAISKDGGQAVFKRLYGEIATAMRRTATTEQDMAGYTWLLKKTLKGGGADTKEPDDLTFVPAQQLQIPEDAPPWFVEAVRGTASSEGAASRTNMVNTVLIKGARPVSPWSVVPNQSPQTCRETGAAIRLCCPWHAENPTNPPVP